MLPWQRLEELSEAVIIPMKAGRELPQDRPGTRFQLIGALEEAGDALGRVFQALDVGDEAAALDGEPETFRRALPPTFEGLRFGQTVEGVVDLDGVETLGVELEPGALRQAFGIKDLAPMVVDPARAANPDLGRARHPSSLGPHQATLIS